MESYNVITLCNLYNTLVMLRVDYGMEYNHFFLNIVNPKLDEKA